MTDTYHISFIVSPGGDLYMQWSVLFWWEGLSFFSNFISFFKLYTLLYVSIGKGRSEVVLHQEWKVVVYDGP